MAFPDNRLSRLIKAARKVFLYLLGSTGANPPIGAKVAVTRNKSLVESDASQPVDRSCLSEDFEELVPVEGTVHLHTDLGVFLDVQGGRRVFIPEHFMSLADRHCEPGQTVTLRVLRSFATQEGFTSRSK